MIDIYSQSSKMVDLQSKNVRSTQSVLAAGGWAFMQLGTYLVGSPLVIVDHVKTKISFPPSQIIYSDGRNLSINYNETTNRFMPQQAGDTFLVNLRMKVKPTAQAGTLDVMLESPNTSFNPITARTSSFNKAAGQEHFIGLSEHIFISADVVTNGLELYVHPIDTNVSVYDISLLVSRTYSADN